MQCVSLDLEPSLGQKARKEALNMTFHEITKMMLASMDFFELRRTAARYQIPYQGVRRQKLIRDLERKILLKASPTQLAPSALPAVTTLAAHSPEGAVSAKPKLVGPPAKGFGGARINTFSTRTIVPRARF